MTGELTLADQTVVVRDGVIVDVGPTGVVPVPADATVVDGQGRFLMPGLADMHTHVATETSVDAAPGQLFLFLANGVTMILGQGDFGEPLPTWARQIREGTLLGPTFYTARYARGPKDGSPASVTVVGEARARQFVRESRQVVLEPRGTPRRSRSRRVRGRASPFDGCTAGEPAPRTPADPPRGWRWPALGLWKLDPPQRRRR
ncbi:MAG: hypothetical protein ACE5HP_06810 [Gemmatimonadota bacterium]